MMDTTEIEPLSVWWVDIKSEIWGRGSIRRSLVSNSENGGDYDEILKIIESFYHMPS